MESDTPAVRPAPAELRQFLAPYDPDVVRLALAARTLVLGEAPTGDELIYDSYNAVAVAYTFSGRMRDAFCHVAVYSRHVNLGFNRGAELPDPDRRLQGAGRSIRHLRIARPEDLEEPHVRDFLRLAIAHARQGGTEPGERSTPTQSVVQRVSTRKRRPGRPS